MDEMNPIPCIAAMTVFCDELFRLNAWKTYYAEYSQFIALHIVINNGDKSHTRLLKESFPQSIIIENENSNLLSAYNLGLKEALRNPRVNAIMQITNDVRFAPTAIPLMWQTLQKNPKLGVVGPVLFKKDSTIIESYGWKLHPHYGRGKALYKDMDFNSLQLGLTKKHRCSSSFNEPMCPLSSIDDACVNGGGGRIFS